MSWFFIQSKLGDLVIDVQGAKTKPGTLLDAFTQKTKSPDWNNQLWTFGTTDFLPKTQAASLWPRNEAIPIFCTPWFHGPMGRCSAFIAGMGLPVRGKRLRILRQCSPKAKPRSREKDSHEFRA